MDPHLSIIHHTMSSYPNEMIIYTFTFYITNIEKSLCPIIMLSSLFILDS